MAQKRNPVSLRLQTRLHGQEKRFACSWFTELFYPQLCALDIQTRLYLGHLIEKGRGWSATINQDRIPETGLSIQFSYRRCCIFSVVLNKNGEESDSLYSMNFEGQRGKMSSLSRFDAQVRAHVPQAVHTFLNTQKHDRINVQPPHYHQDSKPRASYFLACTSVLTRLSQNKHSDLFLTCFVLAAKKKSKSSLLCQNKEKDLVSIKKNIQTKRQIDCGNHSPFPFLPPVLPESSFVEKQEIAKVMKSGRKDSSLKLSWVPFKQKSAFGFSMKREICVCLSCFPRPFVTPSKGEFSYLPLIEYTLKASSYKDAIRKKEGITTMICSPHETISKRHPIFRGRPFTEALSALGQNGKKSEQNHALQQESGTQLFCAKRSFSFLEDLSFSRVGESVQQKNKSFLVCWSPLTQVPCSLFLVRALSICQSIEFCLDSIVWGIKKRQSFQKIQEYIFARLACNGYVKGARILCSGRLGGRSKTDMRSKKQSAHFGETALTVFSSRLAFACTGVNTSFGKIGIKLWICYR